MKTSLEGLLLYKIPYQERHVIAHLLSRQGRLASILFYGGMGGGKKKKSSSLELGHMLQVELAISRSTVEFYRAKEWRPLWVHKNIRHNYLAFSLMCFYLEVLRKISPAENLHDQNLQSVNLHRGGFRLLSNALFYLEKAARFDFRWELLVFLGKLLIEQGLFPQRQNCVFCERELNACSEVLLMFQHGAFACSECGGHEGQKRMAREKSDGVLGRELWELLGLIAHRKYSDLANARPVQAGVLHTLFHYFCFQLHFQRREFKSVAAFF